jgi:uncharacterized protein (DUF58 family)
VDARGGRTHSYRAFYACTTRGAHYLPPVWASTQDLIPVFAERSARVTDPVRVLVLPRRVELWETVFMLDGLRMGDGAGQRRGAEPPSVAGVREWEPGDLLSMLHWPATMQTGQWSMESVYDGVPPVQVTTYIVLDGDAEAATIRDYELLVTIANSYVYYLSGASTRSQRQLGLVTSGALPVYVPAAWEHGKGAQQLQSVLAEVQPGDALLLDDALAELLGRRTTIKRGDIVLLVTRRGPEERAAALERIRQAGLRAYVTQVVDDEAPRYHSTWPVPAVLVPAGLGTWHSQEEADLKEHLLAALLSGDGAGEEVA